MTASVTSVSLLVLVLVKALTALHAHPASIHHPHQQPRGPVLCIARLDMQHLLDRQARVESDQIGERERTHGVAHAESEGFVDIFSCRYALLSVGHNGCDSPFQAP